MQISIKGYITSKESELFYDCADRYAYNKSQNKFAISDGVSKSFFPKIWADVLVNKWVVSKEFDEAPFILDCQKDWLKQITEIVNKPDVKWFTKNAFNRKESGLATFVGLRFYKKKKEWFWKANALGDSFLFFVPEKVQNFSKDCFVLSSKQEPIVFDNYPDYLSSLGSNHKGEKQFKENMLTTGTFYLMTDALAEWFLTEKDNAINKIGVWQNQKDFERFVGEERLNTKLGNDDSAILIIKVEDNKKEDLNYASEEVSNINELIEVEQKEIEVAEEIKKQELILQEKSSKTETSLVQSEEKLPVANQPAKEFNKPKKGLLNRIFGKEESEIPMEKIELGADLKVEIIEENQNKKKSSTKNEENDSKLEKARVSSITNKVQEKEAGEKEEPESKIVKPKKLSQNITNKF